MAIEDDKTKCNGHVADEYRILVDMRWNKQYLDILANKCSFEDEERYMEFLEALNTVANR